MEEEGVPKEGDLKGTKTAPKEVIPQKFQNGQDYVPSQKQADGFNRYGAKDSPKLKDKFGEMKKDEVEKTDEKKNEKDKEEENRRKEKEKERGEEKECDEIITKRSAPEAATTPLPPLPKENGFSTTVQIPRGDYR